MKRPGTQNYPRTMGPEELEPHYSRHVGAMTSEGLHNKSDIAFQLALRDWKLAALTRIITRSLASGQLEKLEDARPYLYGADQPAPTEQHGDYVYITRAEYERTLERLRLLERQGQPAPTCVDCRAPLHEGPCLFKCLYGCGTDVPEAMACDACYVATSPASPQLQPPQESDDASPEDGQADDGPSR